MNLAADMLKQLDNPTLTLNERVLIRCRAAADLIHSGQYEGARDALGDLWQGVGQRPVVEGLKNSTAAEVLLRAGVLSGWIGGARNVGGAQEAAKDLITEALRVFESLDLPVKVAEAQYELGICYWRIGSFDEARIVLVEAAERVGDRDDDLKAKILIRRALVATWSSRYHDALDILEEAETFFSGLDDAFKGRWHGQMGSVLRYLGAAEGRSDYLDRAAIEYTAAIHHYEQAGHERYCAVNHNNLAMLLYRVGRYDDAHENLDRAAAIFTRLNDPGNLAQVNETRARVLLAERRYAEAERVIEPAIQVFERSGEQGCLADALAINAAVQAGLGRHERSLALFRRAINTAADGGALEKAGQAALSLIEEHGATRLSEVDVYETYRRADEFLKNTQDSEDIKRLRGCARVMGRRLLGARLSDPGFTLQAAVHTYEARLIEQALAQAGGSVTRAAQLLGFRHHGSLAMILNSRHRQLLDKRTPVVPRRQSLIRQPRTSKKGVRPVSILYAEDDPILADAVKATLEELGYQVSTYANGSEALTELRSQRRYDLLLLDNELPGVGGLELVRRARQLRHRRRTPVVMLSAEGVETEAWRAGVDAFLRKPEDMDRVAETIKRLLNT